MEKELNALTTSEFFSMLKNQKLYSLKEELMDYEEWVKNSIFINIIT